MIEIKLSDYILEQTISSASTFDIDMEQAAAEIEVACALCEAYFKQIDMLGEDYFEEGYASRTAKTSLNDFKAWRDHPANPDNMYAKTGGGMDDDLSDDEREGRFTGSRGYSSKDYADDKHKAYLQSDEFRRTVPPENDDDDSGSAMSTSQLATHNEPKANPNIYKMADKSVSSFFKSIGNWFYKIWVKFIGWVTEKRMESLKKKLEANKANLSNMSVKVPEGLAAAAKGQTTAGSKAYCVSTFENGEKFLNILKAIKDSKGKLTPGNVDGNDVNSIMEKVDEFKAGLYTELRKSRANLKDAKKDATIDGNQLLSFVTSELEAYRKNKQLIENLQKDIKNNKDIGTQIATSKTFNLPTLGADSAKQVYRALKKVYDMYSTYMANQLRGELQALDPSQIKGAIKSSKGSKSDEKTSEKTGET